MTNLNDNCPDETYQKGQLKLILANLFKSLPEILKQKHYLEK